MWYLLRELEAGDYFVEFAVDDQSRIKHLFFAFEPAIDIYCDNSDVILLECTYKTNRFGVPLLNIVGITGTNSTIHVAQAFIRNEKEPDYAWAFRQLYAMMEQRNIGHPQVFSSDAELALPVECREECGDP
ncbi:hypothetical protein PF005_g4851 [Phytophthora fragariae]|uniref:MULE transposase domain-containing protein n=1 Tax=Phytophthora fragariae TaxID=53985 RepID=A0A6A3T4A6_9STRA|nr:hypothetical protein PF009_g5161 [Phytophthora fragariae]KAE9023198.1 hypothetical protein PF011_g4099 [Phytophthora fragariae]KAE9129185.1 hypothetical protein PF010_g4235 [Phytophthora fragariae]KAE9129304.1 hypothetical protein PF007_g4938 [Phytophthora fragariae]KAE9151523.1 hypothetical protein PF006_g4188 [Phytophthora fragariae]